MKLLIVNSNLKTGGIRQSLLNLLENIKDLDIDVSVQLLKDTNDMKQYKQFDNVHICPRIRLLEAYLSPLRNQKNIIDVIIKLFFWSISKIIGNEATLSLIMRFVRESNTYDIAISFTNDNWRGLNDFSGGCDEYVQKKVNAVKKIGWIHNDPYKLGFTYDRCFNKYRDFDLVVNVSYACKKMFDEIIPEFMYKSEVVYNMFDINSILKLANEPSPYDNNITNIVTVARLSNQQKRIDRVIECCERLKDTGIKGLKWHIIGDGPDHEYLTNLSIKKGISDMIVFEGRKNNPYPYMKHADVFVLTSDYEAYGMVVTESLLVGTPVICTRYPAASEILENGKNGILTDFSTDSLYDAINSIISNNEMLNSMEQYIQNNGISNEKSLKQFLEVIK